MVFKNLVLNCADTGGTGILLNNAAITADIYNCVVYCPHTQGGISEGLYIDTVSSVNIYNCTVCNFNDGIEQESGTLVVKNCAVFNNADDLL